jgi:hypothetical protein
MLTTNEWRQIRIELKKNIEPAFIRQGHNSNIPFEQIVQIFQHIIEKEISDDDLDDREKIGEALKIRYITKDGNLYSSILSTLVIKLETYFKRLFKITNESLWAGQNNMLSGQIVTFVRKFKYTYRDPEFLNANDAVAFDGVKKFFKSHSDGKPVYTPSDVRGLFPFSEQFKLVYNLANAERHSDPEIFDDELPGLITQVISCYLFLAAKYSSKLSAELIHEPDILKYSNWNIFKQYMGNFSKNQTYFLITDALHVDKEKLSSLGNVKWDFIFDLDINSVNDGLYAAIQSSGTFPRVINQIIHSEDDRGRITAIFPDNTTFWYFVQGTKAQQKSLVRTNLQSDWRLMYGRYTQDLMREYYAKKYSFSLNPIKTVVLSKDVDKVKEIIYAVKGMDARLQNMDFIFASDDNSKMKSLISEIAGIDAVLPTLQLFDGMRETEGVMYNSGNSTKVLLPCHSSKGPSVEVPDAIVQSVNQYFQIIHLNILNETVAILSDKTFYQGRKITWQEIDNRYDVDRTISKDIIKKIRLSLDKRVEAEIIYLTHYAGSGGSTIARRIAYEIHKDFPVFFLNETISSYSETQLLEKLLQIYQITEIPSLVVIDNSNITRQQVEILEKVVANRLAKTVFLLTESTFSIPAKSANRFYVPAILDPQETNRFVMRFSQEYKEKEINFSKILTDNPNACNPFYFGLIAHEKEYITIDEYVKKRLEGLNFNEKELLILLSFCQVFANGKLREVPHFIISKFLGIDEDYIRLRRHTQNNKIYDLIIETDDLSWRTIHPLIAVSILEQTLGTNDAGILNPFFLKDFAVRIIKSLRGISENRNEQVLELLHNIFILRGIQNGVSEVDEVDGDFSNNLFNKRLFSKLINDLENNINRLEVFDILTTEFPDENAHFWGHFSRLYSIDRNFEKAIEAIDNALRINEEFIFYHIKGMCYRTEFYRLKDQCFGKKEESVKYAEEMKNYFLQAEESFEIVREIVPNKEHGYIAFIQMVIQMIDYEYSISVHKNQTKDYTTFISSNIYCRSLLTKANEIILDYQDNNQEFENSKIKQLQLSMLRFFGEKEKMINAWQGLLGNKQFDQNLIRRQLAYAYLAKNDFSWELAKGKDIKRIWELCEENLKNKVETRDLRLWFEVSRRLNLTTMELLKKAQEWEFKTESLETSYILMCLYAIQAINGIKSGIENYEKYKRETSKRATGFNYSKVFCIEWVGGEKDSAILLNHRQLGEWSRDDAFFKEYPEELLKVSGQVVKFISRTQGYIEIANSGIQVMYQPAYSNHFSDDAQKGTKVNFVVGFNYDGARAFHVQNI